MYSVIIQNKRTMESFGQFHPLFSETLEKGEVGICQWMEAGTTVEDALPELINLVEGKESWRAVIVRIQDEEDMAVHPAARMNPYDFYENADGDGKIRENPVPLVRLTHMLGGMPVPETRFEARIVESDRMNPKVIYEPVTDPEEMAAHEKLSEKYRLKTKMPEEILLVTLCTHPKDCDDYLRNVWENRKEQESSEFWKRNQYPGSCRFLYCDETKEGEVRRTGDLFYFWTSVLLLASNSINPNTLQAYRLHRMSVEFDKEEMARIMQESADRAERAIRFIKDSIRRELEKTQHTESQIPDYRLDLSLIHIYSNRLPDANVQNGKASFDVPMGEMTIFAQGQNVSINGITSSDGKKYTSENGATQVKYSEKASTGSGYDLSLIHI